MISRIFFFTLFISFFLIQSCMVLFVQESDVNRPLSMTDYVTGQTVRKNTAHYFREEVWVYYLAGIPELSLGTFRNDISYNHLLRDIANKYARQDQAIINLRIVQEKSLQTIIVNVITMGLLSPTAVYVEGNVVDIQPQIKVE